MWSASAWSVISSRISDRPGGFREWSRVRDTVKPLLDGPELVVVTQAEMAKAIKDAFLEGQDFVRSRALPATVENAAAEMARVAEAMKTMPPEMLIVPSPRPPPRLVTRRFTADPRLVKELRYVVKHGRAKRYRWTRRRRT